MAGGLIPDFRFDNIFQITGKFLKERGIRLLLADLDNTLVPYSVQTPTARVRAWKAELAAAGVTLFVVSNNRRPTRPQTFCEALEVPYIGHAGKPWPHSFRAAMEEMAAAPGETAMVGDQIFTDIWGGNNAGVTTLLVRPVELDTIFRKLRYGVEVPFRVICRNKRRN